MSANQKPLTPQLFCTRSRICRNAACAIIRLLQSVAISLLLVILCSFPVRGADGLLADRPTRTAPWPTKFVGNNRGYRISADETLTEVARFAQVGYAELCSANPQIDPWMPSDGALVILPGFRIVPDQVTPGITINLPEFRLYFVHEEDGTMRLRTYPVGIGTEQDETPVGQFKVREKLTKPTWRVPYKVRKERHLPKSVPPGPDNPLGDYWLGISANGVGIHGTNEPFGVGRRTSRGCIRLYPEDISELFAHVPVGTQVTIINQPVKLGILENSLFLEAHAEIRRRPTAAIHDILQQIAALDWNGPIDWVTVESLLRERSGRPTVIGQRAGYNVIANSPR